MLFTKNQLYILKESKSKDRPAKAFKMLGFEVSRQRIDYHINKLDTKKVNKKELYISKELELKKKAFDNYNHEVEEVRKLRNKVHNRILVISDTHAPYQHKDLLQFYKDLNKIIKPDLVINIGDELDNHAMSFHDSDADLDSAGVELQKGREYLHQLAKVFPEVYSVDSNHGSMAYRRQKTHGLPKHLILGYRDAIFSHKDSYGNIINNGLGDKWYWSNYVIANTPSGLVKFKHGEGTADLKADIQKERISIVRGHHHSQFNIVYSASNIDLIYGMTVGCGIDDNIAAFNYNKKTNERPIIGCGLILNGVPRLVPMPLNDNGDYKGLNQLKKIVGV